MRELSTREIELVAETLRRRAGLRLDGEDLTNVRSAVAATNDAFDSVGDYVRRLEGDDD